MPYVNGILGVMLHDPELKMTHTGKPVCSFRIANNYGYGENKKTDYVTCVAWGKNAETVAKYFKKGDSIIVQGEWHNMPFKKEHAKNKKEYDVPNWEYIISIITFIPKQNNKEHIIYNPIASMPTQKFEELDVSDDNIPF